jgi:hypothetical protein
MKKRTTFYFPAKAARRLGQIKRRSRMESGAAVLRAALSAYAELLDVTQAGYKIVVRTKDGQDYSFSPYEPFLYPKLEALRAEAEDGAEEKIPKNFVFPEAAAEKLASIRRASYLDSNADVIRAALASYDELTLVARAGDQILITDAAGEEQVAYTPYAPLARHRLRGLSGIAQDGDPRPPVPSSDGGDIALDPQGLVSVT